MRSLSIVLCLVLSTITFATPNTQTLKKISVVFRHGDRTPDVKDFYPKDPYRFYSFKPSEYGGLTNEGKARAYNLGVSLRNRYKSFLNECYQSSEVYATSTYKARTKMSLQLVLAGMYQPKNTQVWKTGIQWQPVAIHSIPQGAPSFASSHTQCPYYEKELERVKNTKKYKIEKSPFYATTKNLSALTGIENIDVEAVFRMYHLLTAEKSMNLTLPEWTSQYYPHGLIKDIALFTYKSFSYNTLLKRLNGGRFIRKILDSMLSQNLEQRTKVYLYSGHEVNVASILIALGVWKNTIPQYSSSVIFELHEMNGQQFLRLIHFKGIPAEYETLVIPGCTEYCPLNTFLQLTKHVVPDDVLEACYGPPENSLLITNPNAKKWIYEQLKTWFEL